MKVAILFSCDQIISFMSYETQQVQWPQDFIGVDAISCGDILKEPNLTDPLYTGIPTINDQTIIGKNFCDV